MKPLLVKLKETIKYKFVQDVLALQMGTALNLGINFLTSIFLARYLKPASYGAYALVFSLLGSTRLGTQIGLNHLTINQAAASKGENNREKLAQYLAFFLKTGLLIHGGIALAGYIFLPLLAQLLFQKSYLGILGRPLMGLIVLGLFYTLGASLIEGFRQMKLLTFLENSAAMLRMVFIMTVLLLGGGLEEVIYATFFSYLLTTFLALFLLTLLPLEYKNFLPSLKELWPLLKTTSFTAYLPQGIFVGLFNSLVRLLTYLPLFLLGRYAAVEEAGYYQIAYKIVSVPLLAFAAISRNLLPKLSHLSGKKDYSALKNNFWRVTITSGFLSVLFTLPFIFLSPWILLIYGKDYHSAKVIVYWLGIYTALSGLDIGLRPLLMANNKLKAGTIWHILTIILLFPLGVYLTISYGGRGAAGYYSLIQTITTLLGLIYAYFILKTES